MTIQDLLQSIVAIAMYLFGYCYSQGEVICAVCIVITYVVNFLWQGWLQEHYLHNDSRINSASPRSHLWHLMAEVNPAPLIIATSQLELQDS